MGRRRRERWPSRFAYIVASVSAMIGLGSFLRLPGMVAEYGGLTFFIPYFILTALIGYPIFTLEGASGEMHRSGIVTFFNQVYPKFIGFGVLQLLANMISCAYYNIILGWFLLYAIRSSYIPWNDNTQAYFNDFILNVESNSTIRIVNILSCLVIWIIVFISIYQGVTQTTKMVFFTLPFPILMMMMLFIRALTLENGYSALVSSFYVKPHELIQPRIWIEALGQVLLSTSVGFGVASAYGSYRIKDGNMMADAFIVHFMKISFEILSWVCMICIAGHEGWDESDLVEYDGFQLAFVLYPNISKNLPFETTWNFLFFSYLLTLGLDCSHASLEGIVTCLVDSKRYSKKSRIYITTFLVCTGAVMSTLMNLDLNIVAACDYFLTNVWFVLGALGEVLVYSLYYNVGTLYSKLGKNPVYFAHFSWIAAPIFGVLVFIVTNHHIASISTGLFVWSFGSLVSVRLAINYKAPVRHKLYLLFFHQGQLLKHHYNETLRMDEHKVFFKLNMFWYMSLKVISLPFLIASIAVAFISVFYFDSCEYCPLCCNWSVVCRCGCIYYFIAKICCWYL